MYDILQTENTPAQISAFKPSPVTQPGTNQARKIDLASNFQDMLNLALAGIKYQDPLNPKDASELGRDAMVLAQAQALVDIRDRLAEQTKLTIDNQLLQASAQVGRNVEMQGNSFSYDGQTSLDLGYVLPPNTHGARLQVTNEQGTVLQEHDFRASGDQSLEAKYYTYTFDGRTTTGHGAGNAGKLPAGVYKVKVYAFDRSGKPLRDPVTEERMEITTSVSGKITGGTKSPEGVRLKIGQVSYPLEQLLAIHDAKEPQPTSSVGTNIEQ